MGLFDKIFRKKPFEVYSHADYNEVFENPVVEGMVVQKLDLGILNLPSGQIVVCDPLVVPDCPPLTKAVKPGEYPVSVYVAKTEFAGNRYAIAKLEFSTKKAAKWVLAVRDGEDISELGEHADFFGFAVNAGIGAFFDFQTGIEYNQFIEDFMLRNPNGNIYDDFFAAEFKKNAIDQNDPKDIGNWVNFYLPGSNRNVTMFQSGYGDGLYPAYWGMTKDNEIVSLVIDFHVLLLPD